MIIIIIYKNININTFSLKVNSLHSLHLTHQIMNSQHVDSTRQLRFTRDTADPEADTDCKTKVLFCIKFLIFVICTVTVMYPKAQKSFLYISHTAEINK